MDILDYVQPHIKRLKPYSSARHEFKGNASIFLDANENPNNSSTNRYPDPFQESLKSIIKDHLNVNSNQIILGNGSDEIIDLIFRLFCTPGKDSVITMPPTYGMYDVSAGIQNVDIINVPLSNGFEIQEQQVIQAIQNNTKIIFICSPNNPTGNSLDKEKIKFILNNFKGLVVVDEAYAEYADTDLSNELNNHHNLLISRTFSKARGMAGIRLGIGVGHEKIIALLNKIKPPYNVNQLTQDYALNKLKNHSEELEKTIKINKQQREFVSAELSKLDIVEFVYPTDANFLLVKFKNSDLIFNKLKEKGIIVRDRSKNYNCSNCLRITIGKPDENNILIKELNQLNG